MSTPTTKAMAVAIPKAENSRVRLASVSDHRRYSPVRPSSVNAILTMASPREPGLGKSLSLGLIARRSAEPMR